MTTMTTMTTTENSRNLTVSTGLNVSLKNLDDWGIAALQHYYNESCKYERLQDLEAHVRTLPVVQVSSEEEALRLTAEKPEGFYMLPDKWRTDKVCLKAVEGDEEAVWFIPSHLRDMDVLHQYYCLFRENHGLDHSQEELDWLMDREPWDEYDE